MITSIYPASAHNIIVNDLLCVKKELKQYRFPKSKKKRVKRKWAKMRHNFRLEDVHTSISVNGDLFVSTKIYNKIKELLLQGENIQQPNRKPRNHDKAVS